MRNYLKNHEPGLIEYAIILILVVLVALAVLAIVAVALNVFVIGLWAAIVAAVAGIGYAIYEASRGEMWAVATVLVTTGLCCLLPSIAAAIAITRFVR